ncbi:hypothetical protein PQU92_16055 [Asticcacaulis sp. BYS171W]|uniref:Tetratricopeptide repeat protein n=1 Tax=Asticcacaulis aquaticus TaxID=2984212 RepID=A0ABT5HXQ1_9CAUL|nr:hypothetical protein [Asticcacaulis aquaticus]MDC7684798.1 hypothetical protein [Asticcacaulis aquaticus]
MATTAEACPDIPRADTQLFARAERLYKATDQVALEALRPELEAAFNRAPDLRDRTCAGKLDIYAQATLALGWVISQSGDWDSAYRWQSEGLRFSPQHVELGHEAAFSLFMQQKYDDAQARIDALLERTDLSRPQRAGLYRTRGHILIELEQWDAAEAAFRASLKYEPGNVQAKNELKYIGHNRPARP